MPDRRFIRAREQIIAHHNQTLANLATVDSAATVSPAIEIDLS
jgi:hypothetical protein